MLCDDDGKEKKDVYALNSDKVCLAVALRMLRAHGGSMPDKQLMDAWPDAVPFGMKCRIKVLSGHAVHVADAAPVGGVALGSSSSTTGFDSGTWHLLEDCSLSPEPQERLKKMFEIKREWTKEEMLAYLPSEVYPVDKILLKNTRMLRKKDDKGQTQVTYQSRKKF